MQASTKPNYVFYRNDGLRTAIISKEKGLPTPIAVDYLVLGEHRFNLQLKYLDPDFFPASKMILQEMDISVFLKELVKESIEILFPYLDIMENNVVTSTFQMSKMLSEHTELRAVRFAENWNLTLTPERKNIEVLDKVMDSMRTDIQLRREDFFKNEDKIIDLAAYFGKLLSISNGLPDQWYWRELSEGYSRYVVKAQSYDPLLRVIHAWNFGPEVINYALKRFPLTSKNN